MSLRLPISWLAIALIALGSAGIATAIAYLLRPRPNASTLNVLDRARSGNRRDPRVGQFRATMDRDRIWQAYFKRLSERQLWARYGPLITTFELNASQADELRAILVSGHIEESTKGDFAWEDGKAPGTPEFNEAIDDTRNRLEQQLTQLLGSERAKLILVWPSADARLSRRYV